MHIFVDESGTFTHSSNLESWSVVAAYVALEHRRRDIRELMCWVRAIGNHGAETKLKHLSEDQYVWFLTELRKLEGLAFAVAVDVGLHRPEEVARHRDVQAHKVVEHRDKMIHESARRGLDDLSNQIRSLPTQLYTQLVCQLELFHKILTRAPLYFVQRHPPALANFRWRLDRKAKAPTAYEEAFRRILPTILQTMSLADPMIMLEGADYRHFSRFDYPPGEEPTYLKDVYGIESNGGSKGASNIGKMVREDFKLADSAATPGIQVADLIASGIRRLFRGGFQAEEKIARLLGANMIQQLKGETPVILVSLDKSEAASGRTARLIHLMASSGRPMLAS
jgi:hypothetical protein